MARDLSRAYLHPQAELARSTSRSWVVSFIAYLPRPVHLTHEVVSVLPTHHGGSSCPMEDDLREFATRLGSNMRRARTRLDLTQAQVAEIVDVLPEVYGRLERGAMLPSMRLFVAICDTLGVTPNQLLGYSEPQDDLASRHH